MSVLLWVVGLAALLACGFAGGYVVCLRRWPGIMATMTDGEMDALAARVESRRYGVGT